MPVMAVIVVNWVKLSGSFHPPTHTTAVGGKGRGGVLCYTEPLGAVLYRLYFILYCTEELETHRSPCDLNTEKPTNAAVNYIFYG